MKQVKENNAVMRMHFYNGKDSEHTCGDCAELVQVQAGNRKVYKCKEYGITSSAASDWRKGYAACGKFYKMEV